MKLKNFISVFRNKKGFTQYTLAHLIGVSRNTISSLERGEYMPSAYTAYKLCQVLGVTFEQLFYME